MFLFDRLKSLQPISQRKQPLPLLHLVKLKFKLRDDTRCAIVCRERWCPDWTHDGYCGYGDHKQ
jgi:hypothetical protein